MNIEKTYKVEIKGRFFNFSENELKDLFISLRNAFKEVDTTEPVLEPTPVVVEPVSSPVVTEEVVPQASQPAQSGELPAGE